MHGIHAVGSPFTIVHLIHPSIANDLNWVANGYSLGIGIKDSEDVCSSVFKS
jgi:hypothetical protein